jgi:hypothetical protein
VEDGDPHEDGDGRDECSLERRFARLSPSEQCADPHEEDQEKPERLDPRVVEGGADAHLLVEERLGDHRERRRDEDEAEEPHQNPIVEQEGELARQDRLEPRPFGAHVERLGHHAIDHLDRDVDDCALERDERDHTHRRAESAATKENRDAGCRADERHPPGDERRAAEARRRRQITQLGPAVEDEGCREGAEEE